MFSSLEVAEAANVSLRQLQWWDERKVVCPAHVGHTRQYTEQELIEVVAVAALRRRGLSLQSVRRTLRKLQRELFEYKNTLALGGDLLILANRSTALMFRDSAKAFEHMRDSLSTWALISMRRELKPTLRS